MGLFSSKTEIHVQSMSMKLVENTPNYVQQSVLTSVKLERPIVDDLIANMVRGLGAKLTAYYKYGGSKYYYGLPTGSVSIKHASVDTVGVVISKVLGKKVHMESSVYDAPIARLFVEDFLIKTRGWDATTGVVANPPQTGLPPVSLFNVVFTNPTTITITYSYTLGTVKYLTETRTVDKVNLSAKYYHAKYFLIDDKGQVEDEVFYWFYDESTKKYEVLNEDSTVPSKYYPAVPLRHNNQDLTQDDGSDRFNTSLHLLRKVGLHIKELGEGINANPDVGEVDHAYVVLGISPKTTNPASKLYLFEYFKYLMQNCAYTKGSYNNWNSNLSGHGDAPPVNVVTIKSNNISYHVDLGFLYIDSEIIDGSVGKPKTVTSEIVINDLLETSTYDYPTSSLVLRKQLNKTQYEEVTVFGLRHVDYVYGGHTVTTDLNTISGDSYEEDNFLIPLHHDVVNMLGMVHKTELAYDALRIEFHSIVEEKIKWYQQGFFKVVVMVVAVAITIASAGSLSGVLGSAAALVGSTSLIIGALVIATINVAVQFGVAYLVDVLGIELGGILAIAAMVMAAFGGGQIVPPTALTAIQSGISKGIDLAMRKEFQSLAEEMEALQAEMDFKEDELEKMMEEYAVEGWVDPMIQNDSTTGLALPWETPEQYYNTRIHMGNMAAISYMGVENFVASNLKLEGVTTHHGI